MKVQDADVGRMPNVGLGPGRAVGAPEGGLGPGGRSPSWCKPLDHGMVIWATVDVWTQIKD